MPNTAPKIALDPYGLGTILKQFFVQVPLNQRDYAWEAENVKQLFDDFARAIAADEEHFVGSIVTIPIGKDRLEVVDGQQRLATTALLLAAIRERLDTLDEPLLVKSVSDYLTDIDRSLREEVPKLRMNVDDNDLFSALLTAGEPPPGSLRRTSHKNLVVALKLARERVGAIVQALAEKDHADQLNEWVNFLEHSAVAVLLRVPDDVNAFRMFETLNDRGLKVSQADLVKNHLYKTANGRQDEAQTRWTQMRSILESMDDDDLPLMLFLRHALIVMDGPVREVDVFTKVQERAKSPQLVVKFTAELEALANTYVATFNPEHEAWTGHPPSVRRSIEVFNLFKLKPMRPLIVAIGRELPPREAAIAFQFLVSLGVRLIIASTTRSASVEQPLAEAARKVADGDLTDAAAVKTYLSMITPTDSTFRHAFTDARVSNARFARYYLRSLEQLQAEEREPWFIPESDADKITLEHVLPRSPEGNWPTFSDEEAAEFSGRLGNMVLLPRKMNSDLKSDTFEAKRKVYRDAPYVLTAQIADLSEWTPDAIDHRQEQLGTLAIKTWPV